MSTSFLGLTLPRSHHQLEEQEINGQIRGNMWYFLQKLLLQLELEELLIHSFYIQSSEYLFTHIYVHNHQK